MKNSSKLLALGLVLFLGACSAAEGDFLKKVEGKTAYSSETTQDETTLTGTFSKDGKEFKYELFISITLKFDKVIDDSTATYTVTMLGQTATYAITTTDGKKGSINIIGGDEVEFFLK